ncbi:hypothetical protein [Nonomuraea sp. 10N515B]|uniref:hypothetical protein n=1 Tax=Nonomuraea sp. 10N515B TaxID=3457422 RepID=UPI003FCE00F0
MIDRTRPRPRACAGTARPAQWAWTDEARRLLAADPVVGLLREAVPAVTAKDVLDLYALRANFGALLIRRVAMLGHEHLGPAAAALAEVGAAARDSDNAGIRETDLRFQDARPATPSQARTPPSTTR